MRVFTKKRIPYEEYYHNSLPEMAKVSSRYCDLDQSSNLCSDECV